MSWSSIQSSLSLTLLNIIYFYDMFIWRKNNNNNSTQSNTLCIENKQMLYTLKQQPPHYLRYRITLMDLFLVVVVVDDVSFGLFVCFTKRMTHTRAHAHTDDHIK